MTDRSDMETANWIELMDVAKEAVADFCGIKPEEVRVDEEGDIGIDKLGSGAIYLGAEIDLPAFVFSSPVLREVKEKALVYKALNEVNSGITLGQFSFVDGEVCFYYQLLVDEPTPELVTNALGAVLELVDEYGDALKAKLGGKTFNNVDEDEV
jgi:hypothetical protein